MKWWATRDLQGINRVKLWTKKPRLHYGHYTGQESHYDGQLGRVLNVLNIPAGALVEIEPIVIKAKNEGTEKP